MQRRPDGAFRDGMRFFSSSGSVDSRGYVFVRASRFNGVGRIVGVARWGTETTSSWIGRERVARTSRGRVGDAERARGHGRKILRRGIIRDIGSQSQGRNGHCHHQKVESRSVIPSFSASESSQARQKAGQLTTGTRGAVGGIRAGPSGLPVDSSGVNHLLRKMESRPRPCQRLFYGPKWGRAGRRQTVAPRYLLLSGRHCSSLLREGTRGWSDS